MAAFQFPPNPTLGQAYTANNVSFKWNGQGWVPFSSAYQTGADVDAKIAAFGETLVGQIFYRHAVQAKELQCNGQTVSKTTYPSLWTYAQSFLTTDQTANPGLFLNVDASNFKVPILSGYFLRSVGQPTIDMAATSNALGVAQPTALKTHEHIINDPTHSHAPLQGTSFLEAAGTFADQGSTGSTSHAPSTASAATGVTVGPIINAAQDPNETRPYNVALLACIRALP